MWGNAVFLDCSWISRDDCIRRYILDNNGMSPDHRPGTNPHACPNVSAVADPDIVIDVRDFKDGGSFPPPDVGRLLQPASGFRTAGLHRTAARQDKTLDWLTPT